MKKFLFGLVAVVLVVGVFLVYDELSYSPLDDVASKKLFRKSTDLEKLCSIDFLGINPKGEFFEFYKYGVGKVDIDGSLPDIQVWENKELSENANIGKWKACPLDTLSFELYDFTLTVNDFDKWECSNTLNKALTDPNNYYCYIHVNELEQYFLLYNSKEEALYYLRRKGF
jgi:hypothetical protein